VARRVGAAAFVVTCVAWTAALVAAPYVVAHRAPSGFGFKAAVGVYLSAGLVCHQDPARSFHLFNVQLPVCARCAGLYFGAPLGACLALSGWFRGRLLVIGRHAVAWLCLAAVPTALTVGLEWMGATAVQSGVRALTAVPLGVLIAIILCAAVRGDLR
jgi:uncharacterized membrane protein